MTMINTIEMSRYLANIGHIFLIKPFTRMAKLALALRRNIAFLSP